MRIDPYVQFLTRKAITDPMTGLQIIPGLPDCLFPHQRDIVKWALRRGRAALFAGTGLGKSLMELAWAQAVHTQTGKDILHLAPLAVSSQMAREAAKFGIDARVVASQSDCGPGTNITNYQKLDHFDLSRFGGVILDESSILKSTDGHYRTKLIEACQSIPFRLAATATPAPNDFMELGNHAEFLGIMKYTDMLATFFAHDGGDTAKWRLKGHAENEFWKWMASWAVMLRKPSDLGYPNDGYDLPPLNFVSHTVSVDYAPNMDTGMLFPVQAETLQERIAARRATVEPRCDLAISVVTANLWSKLPECHGNQNTKLTDSQKLRLILSTQPNSLLRKAARPNKTGNTCEPTISPTKTNISAKRQKSAKPETRPAAPNMLQVNGSGVLAKAETNTSSAVAIAPCDQNSASVLQNTTPCLRLKTEHAQSAGADPVKLASADLPLIIATKPAQSGDCSATSAIKGLAGSEIEGTCSTELSNISIKPLDQWVIWCHLNSEQDYLERAFGDLCYSVRGSNTEEEKEHQILSWIDGNRPILIGKPSMLGFGLNFQCCHQCVFVGLNDSFEQFYQAVRRFWRFGQSQPVTAHIIASELEGATVANIRRKEADAERMAASMVMHMADLSSEAVRGSVRHSPNYNPTIPVQLPDFLRVA